MDCASNSMCHQGVSCTVRFLNIPTHCMMLCALFQDDTKQGRNVRCHTVRSGVSLTEDILRTKAEYEM